MKLSNDVKFLLIFAFLLFIVVPGGLATKKVIENMSNEKKYMYY